MANRYEKGMLLQNADGDIVRILDMDMDGSTGKGNILKGDTRNNTITLHVIRCIQRKMPTWEPEAHFMDWIPVTEETLWETTGIYPDAVDKSPATAKYIQERYTMIAGILPFIGDAVERSRMIRTMASQRHCSTQTVRMTLCLYLAYQSTNVLAPKQRKEKELTADEKTMRWALNKFFYEVYFTGGSCAAPWAREPWRGYLKQFSPDEVKEPLVSVGLDVGKDRQQFGREMMDMYSSFEKYRDMLPMADRGTPEKQYVVFRGKLHDRKVFEDKCERAGQYYVLFDGSETLLFELKKITSTFQITKTQRQLLEKKGISVTDGEMLRGKGGKICELYIPYIYTSHVGSYKKKPSVLSRFRVWNGLEEGLDMDALHIFVHDFWKYPKEGVYAFDSLEQFRCLYVGESPSGNYGERLALKENTPVNTPESYHRKYIWQYEQTLDEDIADHIGSIITSAPIAEDETGKKTFYEMHLFQLKSGEAFLLGYDELGLCVTSLTDKTLHTWIRKHLGESVYDYIFPDAEPKPCYADTAREIGHCCYPLYNGMWGLVTSKEVRDACEEPMEDETLYQDRETGRFFLYGTGYDRDEYYTMAELNIPCTEAAKIMLSDEEAALWMKEHCEAGTVERFFNGIDPSARD